MRASEFSPDAAAHLVAIDRDHVAFVPLRLPPNLTFSPEQSARIAEAERALGELEGAGSMLPNPELITRPFMRREAVLYSRSEGTIATIEQLVLFEETANIPENVLDVQEVSNYLDALSAGIHALASGYPINKSTMRQLHEILMKGVRGED